MMKKERFDLSDKEQRVMDLLWENPEGLTSVDILEQARDILTTPVYVHRALNVLLAKKLIEECGSVRYNKQYARKFKASMTREEFGAGLLAQRGMGISSLHRIAVAFCKQESDNQEEREKLIEELEQMINDLRGEN